MMHDAIMLYYDVVPRMQCMRCKMKNLSWQNRPKLIRVMKMSPYCLWLMQKGKVQMQKCINLRVSFFYNLCLCMMGKVCAFKRCWGNKKWVLELPLFVVTQHIRNNSSRGGQKNLHWVQRPHEGHSYFAPYVCTCTETKSLTKVNVISHHTPTRRPKVSRRLIWSCIACLHGD